MSSSSTDSKSNSSHQSSHKQPRYRVNPYSSDITENKNNSTAAYDSEFFASSVSSRNTYLSSKLDWILPAILKNYPLPPNSDNTDYALYEGYAGIAYLLWKLNNYSLFSSYINAAKDLVESNRHHTQPISFVCGISSVYSLSIVDEHKKGLFSIRDSHIHHLIKLLPDIDSEVPNEILYGRAGLLYSLLFVRNNIGTNNNNNELNKLLHNIEQTSIQLINNIITIGINYKHKEAPLFYEWHGTNYFGGAHGVVGILYILLQSVELFDRTELGKDKIMGLITETMDYLLSKRYESGNFPSSEFSKEDKYIQWCHGSVGFVSPLLRLFELTKNEKYFDAAVVCLDLIWKRGLLIKGLGLCHGISGNSYCFLRYYWFVKHSSVSSLLSTESLILSADESLHRAWCFVRYSIEGDLNTDNPMEIVNQLWGQPDRPYSLMNGLAGAACLWNDLLKIQTKEPKLPGYDV